ncbi:MAG: agmatinase [Magnetococcales bacterium]|nr:agmatinase [Magnetococcales bacterium]
MPQETQIPFAQAPQSPFPTAKTVILPIPYGGTTSYGGGAEKGPQAILEASCYMELFDEELKKEIWRTGLHTLPFLEPDLTGPKETLAKITKTCLPIFKQQKRIAVLGGEHSITTGVLWALQQADPRPFSVLQLDAHADLRNTYQGTGFSHACVMRRIHEMGHPFVQVGLRSLSEKEWSFIEDNGLMDNVFWARKIIPEQNDVWMDQVIARLNERVYITIDLDVLDPGIFPATGTPEPGGLDYYTLLKLLRRVTQERDVVGFDLVELAPIAGQPASDFLAARIAYKMMGYM